jgi:flagellar motor switch protein FliG
VSEPDVRKAAIVLRSLPDDAAEQLLAQLRPEQAAAVRRELARTSAIAGNEQQAALKDFTAETVAARRASRAADGTAASARFDALAHVDGGSLRAVLSQERPQTIAFVLSRLAPAAAAKLLETLSADVQSAVMCRIAAIGGVDCQIVRDVESALADGLVRLPVRPLDKIDGTAAAAGILAFLDQDSERDLLEDLAHDEPQMVENIRQRLFGGIADETTQPAPRLVA